MCSYFTKILQLLRTPCKVASDIIGMGLSKTWGKGICRRHSILCIMRQKKATSGLCVASCQALKSLLRRLEAREWRRYDEVRRLTSCCISFFRNALPCHARVEQSMCVSSWPRYPTEKSEKNAENYENT